MFKIYNKFFEVECNHRYRSWKYICKQIAQSVSTPNQLNRVILSDVNNDNLIFEATFVESEKEPIYPSLLSSPKLRTSSNSKSFNVINLVPTGIKAEIGGFAGDATPITNLIASVCDYVITNPNAVTASDIYYAYDNVLYLEGNLICQLVLGNIDVIPEKNKQIAVIIEKPENDKLLNNVLNSINGVRAVGGLNISPVIVTDKPIEAKCVYSQFKHASGEFGDLSSLGDALEIVHQSSARAVALVSALELENNVRQAYFQGSNMPNPWGAAEAMLTHMITQFYPFTAAHAPLLTNWENSGFGHLVDPRDGAELISTAYVCSPLKGLSNSPRPVLANTADMPGEQRLSVRDISALILPASGIGNIPFLVALDQNIPVILVEDNKTVSKVTTELLGIDLSDQQVYKVKNYMEAVGVLTAIKAGISLESLKRPIESVKPIFLASQKKQNKSFSNLKEIA